jgi:hypothetical protein
MGDMKMNRRDFLINAGLAGSGLSLFPSLVSSEENDFNQKVKGLAVQDPSNKQKVRGFVYIPPVWGEQLKLNNSTPSPCDTRAMSATYYPPESDTALRRANIGLIESINKYTNIDAYSDNALYLSSQKLKKYPFIYIAADKQFELTNTEKDNFNNYLRNGGFAVLESLQPELDYSQTEASLKQMVKETLKEDARFSPIPNSFNIYHCFFDFDSPPQGTENTIVDTNTSGASRPGLSLTRTFSKPRQYLEGIFLDNRLAVVYSGKGYGKKWSDISNNDPQQKMAVNFVVYALTQGGGIANMDSKITDFFNRN